MTQAGQMAAFVARASYDDLSETARRQLKIRVLDSLGFAIGAVGGEPVRRLRRQGAFHPDRRGTDVAGSGCFLQQRARALSGFQRQLPGQWRDLPPER